MSKIILKNIISLKDIIKIRIYYSSTIKLVSNEILEDISMNILNPYQNDNYSIIYKIQKDFNEIILGKINFEDLFILILTFFLFKSYYDIINFDFSKKIEKLKNFININRINKNTNFFLIFIIFVFFKNIKNAI
jgi:hypothetical protein